MEKQTKVGMNRTGMQMAPVQGPSQVEYAMENPPHPETGSEQAIAELRGSYVAEALPIGSVPLPATGKGIAETAKGKIMGQNPEVLFDKLGERAAYERSGTRLYQAMISKVQMLDHPQQAEILADLIHICNEEHEHFKMLSEVIAEMGGDPTAQTPCADTSAVAALGLIQVITDPRTTLPQGLQALLIAELTDYACWELLIELAQEAGHDELVAPFQKALASENEHEVMIKKWLRNAIMMDIG